MLSLVPKKEDVDYFNSFMAYIEEAAQKQLTYKASEKAVELLLDEDVVLEIIANITLNYWFYHKANGNGYNPSTTAIINFIKSNDDIHTRLKDVIYTIQKSSKLAV